MKKFKEKDLIKILINKASGIYYSEEQLEYEKTQNKKENARNYSDNISFFENNVMFSGNTNSQDDTIKSSRSLNEYSKSQSENLTLSKKKITTHYIPPDMLAIKMLFEIFGKKVGDDEIENLSDEQLIEMKNKLIEELKNEDNKDK